VLKKSLCLCLCLCLGVRLEHGSLGLGLYKVIDWSRPPLSRVRNRECVF
jgi:hypothetical protein